MAPGGARDGSGGRVCRLPCGVCDRGVSDADRAARGGVGVGVLCPARGDAAMRATNSTTPMTGPPASSFHSRRARFLSVLLRGDTAAGPTSPHTPKRCQPRGRFTAKKNSFCLIVAKRLRPLPKPHSHCHGAWGASLLSDVLNMLLGGDVPAGQITRVTHLGPARRCATAQQPTPEKSTRRTQP